MQQEEFLAALIERLALLRLDGDIYQSKIEMLKALYSKVLLGGYVIIDDYLLEPCKKAVQDFRRRRYPRTNTEH